MTIDGTEISSILVGEGIRIRRGLLHLHVARDEGSGIESWNLEGE